MNEILYNARGQVVSWNPVGILTVRQSIPYLLGLILPALLLGGLLVAIGLFTGIDFQWTVLVVGFGSLFLLLGVVLLITSGFDWYRRYPIIVDGLRSSAQIGRRHYRLAELTSSEVEQVAFAGEYMYALSVRTDHGKEYICRGVSESQLSDLHLVQDRLNGILRCESVAGQEDIPTEAMSESVFVGLLLLLGGSFAAVIAWVGFPDYQFVSSRSSEDTGVYIWSLGLYIAYAGFLTLVGLPIKDFLQRRWTSDWKSYLTLALFAAPLIVYFLFF